MHTVMIRKPFLEVMEYEMALKLSCVVKSLQKCLPRFTLKEKCNRYPTDSCFGIRSIKCTFSFQSPNPPPPPPSQLKQCSPENCQQRQKGKLLRFKELASQPPSKLEVAHDIFGRNQDMTTLMKLDFISSGKISHKMESFFCFQVSMMMFIGVTI